jgi:hypothetical protein
VAKYYPRATFANNKPNKTNNTIEPLLSVDRLMLNVTADDDDDDIDDDKTSHIYENIDEIRVDQKLVINGSFLAKRRRSRFSALKKATSKPRISDKSDSSSSTTFTTEPVFTTSLSSSGSSNSGGNNFRQHRQKKSSNEQYL